jgi:phospholipid:diacylglycerol acyltransferase
MIWEMLFHSKCWLENLKLNSTSLLDYNGIKLRNSEGLSKGYLYPGFWILGKLIQTFSEFGYDVNNFYIQSYGTIF